MELFPLRLCVLPSKISGSSARVRKLRYMTLTISEEMVDRSFYPTFHLRHTLRKCLEILKKIRGLQFLDIWCKNVRQKCRESKKRFCTLSFSVNPG